MSRVEVPIRDHSIRLGQLLKLAGLVGDGAEAREVIERGLVAVRGTVETRRGAQVHIGDEVAFGDATVVVTAGTDAPTDLRA